MITSSLDILPSSSIFINPEFSFGVHNFSFGGQNLSTGPFITEERSDPIGTKRISISTLFPMFKGILYIKD